MIDGRSFSISLPHRTRIILGLAVGLVVGLATSGINPPIMRPTIAWDCSALFYLITTLLTLSHGNSATLLKIGAAREDQGRWTILIVMTLAAFVSLIAIGTLLSDIKSFSFWTGRLHLAIGVLTVVTSWSLVHVLFAVHYAHGYYGDVDNDPKTSYAAKGGLEFPGGADPVFSDFLYYAFVVGMTCQVSDIQVSNTAMRRLTLAHGILAFFFNTVILALTVNIGAGLVT